MDNLSVSNIDGHMMNAPFSVEYEVSGLGFGKRNCMPVLGLGTRIMRKGNPVLGINLHRKAGAVDAICKGSTAPAVSVADKLQGIVHKVDPDIGNTAAVADF